MGATPTIKIMPENEKSQGAYVEINIEDFDPTKHVKYVEGVPKSETKKSAAKVK